MKTRTIHIGGMTCVNCQNRIEKKLNSTVGVESAAVNFGAGTAVVTYNTSVITLSGIKAVIEKLDYTILGGRERTPVSEIAGALVIILSLYVLLQGLGVSALTSAFPLAEAGMGYGMLFIIGLVTSVHCAAMCGGINLSQCIQAAPAAAVPGAAASAVPAMERRWKVLFPAVLYNAGRVVSYTAVGVIVGALGSVISVSGRFQGMVQITAGVFMVIMGLNMLGLFPALRRFNLHLPKIFARKIESFTGGTAGADPSLQSGTRGPCGQKAGNKSPLIIGLLNGLMPCGPLQAMQLYALSTANPVAGGVSLFLFSMGTVPLMFGIGALSSVLSKKFTRGVMKAGAVLVTVMGMTMFTYGLGLGFNFDPVERIAAAVNTFVPGTGGAEAEVFTPVIKEGVQIINSTLSPGRYPAITVQQGVPVRWTINAPQGSINGCNNRMNIREYKIEHRFTPGENVIEFTPARTGRFSYSCWMGMIRGSITVVEEGQALADTGEPGTAPFPAGVAIPVDGVVLAELQEGVYQQRVTVTLRDDGIEPAIIVVQRNIPALWTINNDSSDPGNSRLIFPAYYVRLDMEQGDNFVQLMPAEDFDFSTGDHVFYGYVKVVDDIHNADIEAIKTEVSEFETLIYPDAYFEEAAQGSGCCRRQPF
ncbi:MAG: sulfite exporter TauE/SafE family protein [Treponema sp.]|jgi:sulfite exporter TauE/SafE/copper chaperone CopZ/plastocyanin domain-containing protein|nr:sulfite exporter TauE/SafE family protein [Treponema sp.]